MGFVALADPTRPDAAGAVKKVRESGVRVVLITGDHAATARTIADELDIDPCDVYSRVSPAGKAQIVRDLQAEGWAVAMTGNGANDAPAMRLADCGIALGLLPAVHAAADIVISDDRLDAIGEAIAEARGMWASVRDAFSILLGGNLGEVAFAVAATAVSGRAPLTVRQLLLVNMLTDLLPALTIAVRLPPECPETLLRKDLTRRWATPSCDRSRSAPWRLPERRRSPGRRRQSHLVPWHGAVRSL